MDALAQAADEFGRAADRLLDGARPAACARHRRVGTAGWLALAAVGLVYVAAVLKSLKLRKAKLG